VPDRPRCAVHDLPLVNGPDYVGDETIWTCARCSAEFMAALDALDKAPPEASFDNVKDMMAYLNDEPN
jgi:hypothetical protein